jgi:hypothetical protein
LHREAREVPEDFLPYLPVTCTAKPYKEDKRFKRGSSCPLVLLVHRIFNSPQKVQTVVERLPRARIVKILHTVESRF